MPKIPVNGFNDDGSLKKLQDDQIEHTPLISQDQLNNAKIFSSREEYIKHLPKNIKYMEIGVSWGYYSKLIADICEPNEIWLLDRYSIDSRCWSWVRTGSCQCEPTKHTILFTPETHEKYIKDEFSKYKNVYIIKGEAENTLPNQDKDFDYIYFDTHNDREHTKIMLDEISKHVKVGGIIGINDYLIYDGMNWDDFYGTYFSVNWFLNNNKNWSVKALALQNYSFNDIYLTKDF
jgi:hypothetical protein